MEEDPEKKKRGRKPKNMTIPKVSEQVVSNEVIPKSKKGRKPKCIYNAFDATQNNASCIHDHENIIVRLNVLNTTFNEKTEKVDSFDDPCAYNVQDYTNLGMINSHENLDTTANFETSSEVRVLELLKDFEEKNKNNEWPSNTSIACYWCCHKFNNSPYGIPINFKNGNFDVVGCFCSLECASSYNFKNNDNVDEMWERYNLINLMCRRLNQGNIVKPAPDILSLKMFGGHLEIDSFREYFKTNRVINVNFPPMTSITQQLEEINENEMNNEYKFIPLDNERINKYKEKILFKRSKALINNSNSLEHTMKLTVG